MSKVSTYLNFNNRTEEAFTYYKSVFETEFTGIVRFKDMHCGPDSPGNPQFENLIMHVELPIAGGHVLMGSDAPEDMGFTLHSGNTVHINVQPDTRVETKRLYEALSDGGNKVMPLNDMPWGAYFGTCTDKFGVSWMFNCNEPNK